MKQKKKRKKIEICINFFARIDEKICLSSALLVLFMHLEFFQSKQAVIRSILFSPERQPDIQQGMIQMIQISKKRTRHA